MNMVWNRRWLPVLVGTSLGLGACGGGGSGGAFFPLAASSTPAPSPAPSPAPAPAPTAGSLAGVAAIGAPLANATITVIDQRGVAVCATTTDSLGRYACSLPTDTKAPLVVKASSDDAVYYSAIGTAGGTANVSPLTTVVVSRLTPDGNPASIEGLIQTSPNAASADAISKQVSALNTALAPVLAALGVPASDFLTGTFAADGSGQDKLLDTLNVTVRPDGSQANIDIAIKTADGSTATLHFSSADTAIPSAPSNVVVAAVPGPTVVADLMARFTSCYALPLTQRVSTATSDTKDATGTATDVSAALCKALFLNDDPSSFYSNGNYVGRNASNAGAFASLFRAGATGVVWDAANVEFFRANGDMVLSYRSTDTKGNVAFDTLLARNVSGVLKVVGNGNAYKATVQPYEQFRELVNTPAYSHYGSGYDISIPNITDSNGDPIFTKAVVTAPWGEALTLYASAGYSSLRFKLTDGTISGTSAYRLQGAYDNTSTAGNPSDKESGLVYAPTQMTDAQMAALDNLGVWTIEFFHADKAKSNVIQTTRTLTRPRSIKELRQQARVSLTSGMRSALVGASSKGYFTFSAPDWVDFSTDGGGAGWSVPDGVLPPTQLSVFGKAPFGSTTAGQSGAGFNDTANMRSTARSVVVYCSAQTQSDKHCDSTDTTKYAANVTLTTFLLQSTNRKQSESSYAVGLYKLQ